MIQESITLQKYLLQQFGLTLSETRLHELFNHPKYTKDRIWIPVVCSTDDYMKRLAQSPGVTYNYLEHFKEKPSCAQAFGVDRRQEGIYFVLVDDKMAFVLEDEKTLLHTNYNNKPSEVDCLRITEYMAFFDYVFNTRQILLDDTGGKSFENTILYTRTTSLNFGVTHAVAMAMDGGFRLCRTNLDDQSPFGVFREVHVALIL